MRHRFLLHNSREFLQQADPPGGGPAGPTGSTASTGVTGEENRTFTQSELGKIVADERKKAADAARADMQKKLDDEKERADKEARDAALKAQGDFETLENQLKAERADFETRATTAEARLKEVEEAMNTGLEASWSKLPESVTKLYQGAQDDVLAKWKWLNNADVQALVTQLGGNGQRRPGNTPNPPGGNTGVASIDDEVKALASSGAYTM